MTSLTSFEKAVLGCANRAEIVSALASVKKSGATSWLGAGHKFQNGVPPRKWKNVKAADHRDLIDLIAVSAPNHCIDGWGFLARALSSLVSGDLHAARHFGYYAELRAALSLLSAVGIGVFDGFNCIVDKVGAVRLVDDANAKRKALGTHAMAWLALNEWASGPNAGSQIATSISIRKTTLDNCLSSMWPGSFSRPGAYDLILAWGVDLRRSLADRHARNNSSYTAQSLNPISANACDTLQFMVEFWDALEPDAGDPFLKIDRHLLRILSETQFRSIHGGGSPAVREGDLGKRYADLAPAVQAVISQDFLCRKLDKDNLSLIEFASTYSSQALPQEIISRAALLLRSATAMVTGLLFDAGIRPNSDLNFWITPFGTGLGFWDETNGPPTPMHELWADVQQAIDDASQARNVDPLNFSRYAWSSSPINGMPRIFEAERVALWSLCS